MSRGLKVLVVGVLVVLVGGCAGGPLQEFVGADLRAAQARAEGAQDVAGATCWKALADDLAGVTAPESPKGLADAYELARLADQRIRSGVPRSTSDTCAALEMGFLRFLIRTGLRVSPLP